MTEDSFDVAVIGAGPGGYVSSIRAAQLGMRVAVVEREQVGGVCLNWGCIPSKALLQNAYVLSLFRRAGDFGVSYDNLRWDLGKAVDRSRRVVQRLVKGVEFLLRKNKVQVFRGEGSLKAPGVVHVTPEGRSIQARAIILATGARPASLPGLPVDGQTVITSREALEMRKLPQSVLIVGGGAIGCEFAYLYNAYGAEVTIVELLPHLLPAEDEEISGELEKAFQRQGIKFHTGSRVETTKLTGQGARVAVRTREGTLDVDCEKVLVSVGVTPNVGGLGLEGLGVEMERGFVKVDDRMATNVPGLYAIGDVTGRMMLAHVAMAQGVVAVETMAGLETTPINYKYVPRAVYCHPQVTSIGFTEKEAKEAGKKTKVGRFPFIANGKALAMGEGEGLAKVILDAEYGDLLGAHIIGPEATELLPELTLANMMEATSRELGWVIHSHPTLSEVVKEAVLAAEGQAIHI